MKFFVLIPIVFPIIMAIISTRLKFENERDRNVFLYATVILNLAVLVELFIQGEAFTIHLVKISSFLDVYFKIDKLGILFSILASTLWIFTTSYSIEYMKHEKDEKRFFTFFLATLGITVGIALSANLFTMYIFYELLTLSTFPLVIHAESKDALYSGKKYLIYSFGGATLALLGMMILYSITNNLDFIPKGVVMGLSYDKTLMLIAYMSMFIGFGVKAAMVPLHSWLPAAMVAPTPVSSLLHAVAVVKSGVFALIRVSYFLVGAQVIREINGNVYISILVVLTILMGSFLALHQDNLKKRLAYSTISQLGYIVLGIVLLNKEALTGAIMHLINHAVIKITLFFCVGAIYYKTHKKNIGEIEAIGKNMPITMWCFSIAAISLIGIPPTNAFVSKWYLALGGLDDKVIFPIIILLSAFLTAMYILPIVVTAFFHIEENKDERNLDPSRKMLVPIITLTGIIVFLGLFPNVVLNFVKSIVAEVL
ncbi:MAG: proton-conducting transporter membrane subunit [Anaeromicrobium sp.]|uniref:complex I subunit 5 family protein n=1 Tax=Anaeromicrobium sp. TaxID=1929132 RepID=UPI0025FD8A37|nr:proton-conducting transporter membrane subunit [Anaeromicrobium sp.]MCT4596240.1 proton-conducting transporter membrane subunit [Anaeromicrobium sp.]